jgi:hypothetical protein
MSAEYRTTAARMVAATVSIPASSASASSIQALATAASMDLGTTDVLGFRISGLADDGTDREAITVGDATDNTPSHIAAAAEWQPPVRSLGKTYVRAAADAAITDAVLEVFLA